MIKIRVLNKKIITGLPEIISSSSNSNLPLPFMKASNSTDNVKISQKKALKKLYSQVNLIADNDYIGFDIKDPFKEKMKKRCGKLLKIR